MNIFQPLQKIFIVPKRSIASFDTYVTIEEIATDELEFTTHPVQQGASITDHSYLKPANVVIKILLDGFNLADIYSKFLELQSSREPFDVVTGKRTYKNMLLKSLAQTTDSATEKVLSLTCDLTQIILTDIEVVTVADRSNQSNAGATDKTKDVGKKSPVPATPERSKSILRAIGDL